MPEFTAEGDLRALAGRGMRLSLPKLQSETDRPLRRSAVLILFGTLDRTPASASAAATGIPAELDVLLTRRSTGMRHHAGEIAFPGGGAEPGDNGDLHTTALREAAEETGLDIAGVEVLGSLPDAHIPVSNNLVTPVLGWWRSPSDVAADHTESIEVFRVPVADLIDPAARGTSVLKRGSLTHRGPAFRLPDTLGRHIVWGFTGILLATMFDELGWAQPWSRDREFLLTR